MRGSIPRWRTGRQLSRSEPRWRNWLTHLTLNQETAGSRPARGTAPSSIGKDPGPSLPGTEFDSPWGCSGVDWRWFQPGLMSPVTRVRLPPPQLHHHQPHGLFHGGVAQQARALPRQGRGREFEPRRHRHGRLAHPAERQHDRLEAGGSSPSATTQALIVQRTGHWPTKPGTEVRILLGARKPG